MIDEEQLEKLLHRRATRYTHRSDPREATFRLGLSDTDDSGKYHQELDAAIDAAIRALGSEKVENE